jgi:peptidyl-prolyl cis-trans isomerase C
VALPIILSLAVGCATAPRDDREPADVAASHRADLDAQAARYQEQLAKLEAELRTTKDDAELARRDLTRARADAQAASDNAAAQDQALQAALKTIRARESELADLRGRLDQGGDSSSELAGAAELLRQKDLEIRGLQEELARAKGQAAPPPPDGRMVRPAGLDLEVQIGSVDDEPVTRRDFCDFLYRDLGTPQLFDLYANRVLVLREARRRGVEVSDVDCAVWVQGELIDGVKQAGSEAAFDDKLKELGFDRDAWTARLRYQARPTLLLRKLVELDRSTPDGAAAFDERVRDLYQKEYAERVTASHIFISAPRTASPAEVEAARQKAAACAAQVRQGVPFADVAKRFSEDRDTRLLGGNLGTFDRTRFARAPELNTALFTLPPGEVSQPVRSALGFHVLLVDHRTPPARPFDEALKRELMGRLSKEPPADAELEALLARLRARAHVTRTLTFD